jgi:hypothetical protein
LLSRKFRSRGAVTRLGSNNERVILGQGFPSDLDARRAASKDLLIIGIALFRTVPTSVDSWAAALNRGARIRVMLVDPTRDEVVRDALYQRNAGDASFLRARIEHSLAEFTQLKSDAKGRLEIRVSPFVPAAGMNVVDAADRDALVVAQWYEHRPPGEPLPILRLQKGNAPWFEHFRALAERMWEDGVEWPLSASSRLKTAPAPAFSASFGPEVMNAIDEADSVLITGVARNTLLTENFGRFENWLRQGKAFRFLLFDPASDSMDTIANRYYVERSAVSTRSRLEQSLRLSGELQSVAGDSLTVRITQQPPRCWNYCRVRY